MIPLQIVEGNDFYLMVPVRKIVFVKDSRGKEVKVKDRIPLEDCLNLTVHAIDHDTGKCISLPFTISEDDDSMLITKVKSNAVHQGWYGLEVKGTYDGRKIRSYEQKVFKIVENNGKSFVSGMMYEGEQSYQIDTMWMLYACPGYAHLYIDLDTMNLIQVGVVDEGRMYLDENGKLCMHVTN